MKGTKQQDPECSLTSCNIKQNGEKKKEKKPQTNTKLKLLYFYFIP